MKNNTEITDEMPVKVHLDKRSSSGKCDLHIRYVKEEALIDAFLRKQSTIIVGSNSESVIAFVKKLLREKPSDVAEGIGFSVKNSYLRKYLRNSERIIVSTEKTRSLAVAALVLIMKAFKRLHELSCSGIFLAKKTLVFRYGFLLGNSPIARFTRMTTLGLLDSCVFLSEFSRIVSLKSQRALLTRGYYYKERVFSDDMLHTIAQELSKEIGLGRLECKIKIIQAYLNVSYRQANKIYHLLKRESLA